MEKNVFNVLGIDIGGSGIKGAPVDIEGGIPLKDIKEKQKAALAKEQIKY